MEHSDLKAADILLSTGDAIESRAIRGASLSRYSHAALYIGDGDVIEAIADGVKKDTLTNVIDDDTLVAVYRRAPMSEAQATAVVRYAVNQRGKSYDYTGALGAGVTSGSGYPISFIISPLITSAGLVSDVINRVLPERTFFCSELVAMAFASANVPLTSGAASTTPADISCAHVVSLLGYLKGAS